MKDKELAWWLVENAGPVIRYRTLREILEVRDLELISDALERLFTSSLVQKWLERLIPRMGFHAFHSSLPTAFENAMGKLVQLGLHAGLQQLDVTTIKFRNWLADRINSEVYEDVGPWNGFSELLLTSFLAYAGYDTTPVREIVLERLEVAKTFAQVFDSEEFYMKNSNKEWLVHPKFYIETPNGLPLVHDIRGFASSKWLLQDAKYKSMVENIVSVILTPEYQNLQPGYGYLKYGKSYYSIGWSVHLPFFLPDESLWNYPKLLLSLEMMAPFNTAREDKWFTGSLLMLEDCRTEEGHYRFPPKWLPEKSSGYWDGGHYMALEDNRRKRTALDYESTFRVLHIRKLAGLL
jgi:hypothetical protein